MPAPISPAEDSSKRSRKPRIDESEMPHGGLQIAKFPDYPIHQSIFKNFTSTGEPTSSFCPVAVNLPVSESIRKTTMSSDF